MVRKWRKNKLQSRAAVATDELEKAYLRLRLVADGNEELRKDLDKLKSTADSGLRISQWSRNFFWGVGVKKAIDDWFAAFDNTDSKKPLLERIPRDETSTVAAKWLRFVFLSSLVGLFFSLFVAGATAYFLYKQTGILGQQANNALQTSVNAQRTQYTQILYDEKCEINDAGKKEECNPAYNHRIRVESAKALIKLERSTNRTPDLSKARLEKTDLSRFDLSGLNLSAAIIIGAHLIGADLSGADLSRADLSDADLSRADLSGADLIFAGLSGADLSDANLSGADLSNANLRDARLDGANLQGADLSDADLSGALFWRAEIDPERRNGFRVFFVRVNLSDANLISVNLRDASLISVNLSSANLSKADLIGADLSGADLSGAHVYEADFSGANLEEANLKGSSLKGSNFKGSNLKGADLSSAEVSQSQIDMACGDGNTTFTHGSYLTIKPCDIP